MVKSKVLSIDEALKSVKDGTRLMLGGFLDVGGPIKCVEKLIEKGVKDLTIISVTPGTSSFGKSILYKKHMVKELIATHVGTSIEATEEYLNDNLILTQFYPMGTWAEKIRAGAVGLPGVLIPVGIGILDEEGLFPTLKESKKIINVNGTDCFIEPALTASVSIVKAWRADELGNLQYKGTSLNINPDMAMAGKYTIAEVNEIVPVGTIPPECVGTPGVFVDAIVQGHSLEEQNEIYCKMWVSKGKL